MCRYKAALDGGVEARIIALYVSEGTDDGIHVQRGARLAVVSRSELEGNAEAFAAMRNQIAPADKKHGYIAREIDAGRPGNGAREDAGLGLRGGVVGSAGLDMIAVVGDAGT